MSSRKEKLIIFSAPSGSGKTTLVRHLLKQDIPFGFSISATSRPPRGQEKDGVDYYFLSTEAFQKEIAQGSFLEYEEVYPGTFYGTFRSEVDRLQEMGNYVLFDIDVEGGLAIKKQFSENCLALFIQPPSLEALEQRLRNRGTDTEAKIEERLSKAKEELSYAHRFDQIIINNDLATAQKEMVSTVREFLQQ